MSILDEHVPRVALGVAAMQFSDGTFDATKPGVGTLFSAKFTSGKGIVQTSSRDGQDFYQTVILAWIVVRARANRIRQLLGVTDALPDLMEVDVHVRAQPYGEVKKGTSGEWVGGYLIWIDNGFCLKRVMCGGSSAGVMMLAAYVSLVTGLPVDRLAAFTGAIDLR